MLSFEITHEDDWVKETIIRFDNDCRLVKRWGGSSWQNWRSFDEQGYLRAEGKSFDEILSHLSGQVLKTVLFNLDLFRRL